MTEQINPAFWISAIRTAMHCTDCADKVQTLTNAADKLEQYIAAIRALSADRGEAVGAGFDALALLDAARREFRDAAGARDVLDWLEVAYATAITTPAKADDAARARDCTCYGYEGRDCRRCFDPPYPNHAATPPSPAESTEGDGLIGVKEHHMRELHSAIAFASTHGACSNTIKGWAAELAQMIAAPTAPPAAAPSQVSDADGKSALWALRQIMGDMRNCDNWDWLDPAVQKVANELVARNPYADLSQPQPGRVEGMGSIRQAVADYMWSEGCDCCSDHEAHEQHAKRLAELLDVAPYDDGSGYDFSPHRSNP